MEHIPKPKWRIIQLVWHGKNYFGDWLDSLKDAAARETILGRLRRVSLGNFGDYRPVGEGLFEIRIHFGPGFRIYFAREKSWIVLLICGGDKSTQSRDIEKARRIWAEYRRRP